MNLIVVTMNDQISQHFGQSPQLNVYTAESKTVRLLEIVDLGAHQHTGVPTKIIELRPDVVICGNLGQNAKIRLEAEGIRVISGAVGSPETAVRAFLDGNLEDRDSLCAEHQHRNGQHHDHHHDHDE